MARLGALILSCLVVASAGSACKLRPQTAGTAEVQRDIAPGFQLSDEQGNAVSLASLTQSGPVVLVFYRGHW